MRRVVAKVISVGVALAVASVLPVVPIYRAAVIPEPIYSLCYASMFAIFNPHICGVRFRAGWCTLAVMLLLLTAAVVLGLKIGKRLSRPKGGTSE